MLHTNPVDFRRANFRIGVSFGLVCLLTSSASLSQTTLSVEKVRSDAQFDQIVAPFVQKNCAGCHNDQLKTSGLSLTKYHDSSVMLTDRGIWEKVVRRVRAGEMPPKGMPRPTPESVNIVTQWIENAFSVSDRTTPADPGHLTAHRLNRVEYDNSVRDLLAVNFKPAADFPADDSGYGFDNIGDVLSVSPVLMEKYLNAATRIANRAIPSDALPGATRVRFSPEHSPAEGDYQLRVAVGGRREAFRLQLLLDGKEIIASDVLIEKDGPRSYESKLHVPFGTHLLSASMEPRTPSAEETAIAEH